MKFFRPKIFKPPTSLKKSGRYTVFVKQTATSFQHFPFVTDYIPPLRFMGNQKRDYGGINSPGKEKGVNHKMANPSNFLVGQGRIELPTHGFSVHCSTD